ncbi:MAG: phospholipid carrier-dependent glycosyltransferase [Ardenticatenales bacterium]|nr:phospholipid carrier-dependent glycosyltransferase [Ardenticatenales bacterium]
MDISQGRRVAVGLFFLALALYLLTYVGAFKTNDERAMFSSTDSFVKRREFTTNQIYWDYSNVGMLATTGEMVPNYEPAQSILAIPFYLWGRALDATAQAVMLFGAVATAASVAMLYLCLLELGYDARTSALASLVYAFATITWSYSKTFFRDPLTVLAYLVTVYALLRYRPPAPRGWRWPALAGLGLGLALATKQVSVALIPSLLLLVAGYEWQRPGSARERLRDTLASLIPLALILFLTQLYYIRTLSGIELFARDIVDYSTNPQLSSSDPLRMGRALLGLTISPFRGIFWYAPVLLLAFIGTPTFLRRHRVEGLAFLLLVGAHLLGYSRYNYWSGGVGGAAWGARYLLGVIPFLILLTAPVFEWFVRDAKAGIRQGSRAAGLGAGSILLLIVISVGIQIIGVSINPTTYELRHFLAQAEIWGGIGEAVDATFMVPTFSPVFGSLRLLLAGTEPLDVAWVQLREQGTWALLPGALLLSLLNVGLALLGCVVLWRRPALAGVVGGALAVVAVTIVSILLTMYREGDSRYDPYRVDRFLQPMADMLKAVPCQDGSLGEPRRCDGAVVVPDPVLTDYFLTTMRAPLPWYAIDQQLAEADVRLLEQLLRRYPTLWLVRDRSAAADDEQGRRVVERYLSEHGYKVEEQRVEEWARLLRFSGAGLVAEQLPGERSLGEMTLVRGELRVQREHGLPAQEALQPATPTEPLDDGLVQAAAGDVLQLGLTWRAETPPQASYTAFVQLLDSTTQVVLQRDRLPGDGLFPTISLQAGKVLTDNLALPLDVPPGTYRLIVGMYRTDIEGLPRLVGPEGDFLMLAEIRVH